MFDLYVELIQICWQNFSLERTKRDEDCILEWIYRLLFGFVLGAIVGLLYCEYIAELPNQVQPPISDFWFQLLDEFGV
jgi:hypothetical protein